MTAHYLFEPDFCNVASSWEKGIVFGITTQFLQQLPTVNTGSTRVAMDKYHGLFGLGWKGPVP
jgi:hypothetical protein